MRARSYRPRGCAVLAVSALALTCATTALASHPKPGRTYRGFTSAPKLEGFGAPVSFHVSADGSKLLRFSYASLGCFGAGGFRPGVSPFTGHSIIPVGTVSVNASGHFAVTGARSGYAFSGSIHGTLTTTTNVTGRFASAGRATGTITFIQTQHERNHKPFSCGPETLGFTAKVG